jgi:hypothetical protein
MARAQGLKRSHRCNENLSMLFRVAVIALWMMLLASCGLEPVSSNGIPSDAGVSKVEETNSPPVVPIPDVFVIQDIHIYDPLSEYSDEYRDACIHQVYLRCPPYDEYWIAEAWIDVCDDYKVVLIKNCRWQHECDPTDPIIEKDQPCQMDDGGAGIQTVYCDKGKVTLTECTPCTEEICDGIDNDCDGDVDEGTYPCETICGPGVAVCVAGELILCNAPEPEEEICDYVDNDCDGLIDEGQRNDCDKCGLLPSEICNGIDDDCDGDTDEGLVQECFTPCESGIEQCIMGMWIGCTAKQPQPEVCDGFDNDCDGQIDEELECVCTIGDVGAFFPCQEPPLLCGLGYKTCECVDPGCQTIVTTECYAICHWLANPWGSDPACDSFTGMTLSQEECNNFDDNCNQLIDEDLYEMCYTGLPGTLGVGVCIAGEVTCKEGVWGNEDQGIFISNYCKGEVTPTEEICNGLDDDCDGETDWGYEIGEHDILFVIDWSGSMMDDMSAVMIALNTFAQKFSDEEVLKWGIVIGPVTPLSYPTTQYLKMHQDLVGFSNFMASMALLDPNTANGSYEMLLDALFLSLQNLSSPTSMVGDSSSLTWKSMIGESDPVKEQFLLSWRPEAKRIIILFSDEPPQSYLLPMLNAGDIIVQVQGTPDLKVYIFSDSLNWEWDEIALASGGKYYELTQSPTQMYNNLIEILNDICMPGSIAP